MFFTTMSMKNQLLVFTIYCLVTLPQVTGENRKTLSDLLQVAEEQHETFKRSLGEINKHMSAMGETSVDSLLRDRRDNLELFADSLVSFCQTFLTKQQSNSTATTPTMHSSVPTTPMIPTKPSVTLPTSSSESLNPEWGIPTTSILPQSAQVVILPNETLVQFKVQHSVTGFVIPALTIRDLGKVEKRELHVGRHERLPKVSEVSFTIQTHWCADYIDKPTVSFDFVSKSQRDISNRVEVKVCDPSNDFFMDDWNAGIETTHTPTSNDLLPPKAIYRYKLTKEKRQNTTFLAEINLTDFQNTRFIVITKAYSKRYRNMTTSVFSISQKIYKDPTSGFEIRQLANPNTIPSRFTEVKGVTDLSDELDNPNTIPSCFTEVEDVTDRSDERGSGSNGDNQPKGMLKLTFNTAMGGETAIVYFVQSQVEREQNISSTFMTLPLFITGENEREDPIPDGIVSFEFTLSVQTCNTDTIAHIRGYNVMYITEKCAARCHVYGNGISHVQITRKDGALVGKTKAQSIISQRSWTSILKLDPWKPTNDTYQCKVWTESGREFVHDIDLVVADFPRIDSTGSYANERNGTFTLICMATGTDVDISFVRVESGEHGQISTRIDDNPDYEKTVGVLKGSKVNEDDLIHSTLDIPEHEAKNDLYDFFCNATNYVAYDSEVIHID